MDFLTANVFAVVNAFAVLTVIGQIISVAVILALLFKRADWVSKNGILLMLIVAVVATLGSLFLSEIAGWTPCKYCWIQRIFMYPQVILLAIALWKKDRTVARYILALSILGLGYAVWHYFIQMQNIIAAPENPATPCDATGESCVKTPFVVFGYVTIPLMALSAFLLNILGSVAMLGKRK